MADHGHTACYKRCRHVPVAEIRRLLLQGQLSGALRTALAACLRRPTSIEHSQLSRITDVIRTAGACAARTSAFAAVAGVCPRPVCLRR